MSIIQYLGPLMLQNDGVVGRGKSSGRIRVGSFQEKSGRAVRKDGGNVSKELLNFLLPVCSKGGSLQ